MTNYTNKQLNIDLDRLYTPFHQDLVKKAANRQEFLNYLEPEDALQEAGLGWVLGVRSWVTKGKTVPAERINTPLPPEVKVEDIVNAGLPIPDMPNPEFEEFRMFLNGAIFKHLREVARKEYRYKKRLHKDEFDESFLAPDLSIEELLEERENLNKEEWQLEALRLFLDQPALMELIGLTTTESVIIYKFYHDNLTNREVAETVKLSNTRTDFLRQRALAKLRKFLS